MSEALQIALINLIAKVGVEAALEILTNINKASSIDDAIAALSNLKSYKVLKNETA